MLVRLTALAALLACLVLAAATPAGASSGQRVIFDAPRDLLNGATRERALAELDSLGVRELRLVVFWRSVAPRSRSKTAPKGFRSTDPNAYDWGEYDAVMAAARARGWPVVLTLSGPVPRWATKSRRDTVTRPDPAKFGRFVTAVARRYGGQVRTWSIWNEPNHPDFLRPQYAKGKRPLSPAIYRSLYLAAHRALRATGQGRETILFGETAPVGTGKVVNPLHFLRGTLCLNRNYEKTRRCGRLPTSGYAHHPYTPRKGPFHVPQSRNDVTIGVLSRLTKALDRSARRGRIRRGLPIYLTEFGIQSTPDRYNGVPVAQQPEFQAISERIAWGNRRVKLFSQYLLTDDDPIKGVPARSRYGGFETGLRFSTGRAKPSLNGWRLPLSVRRSGSRVSIWGLVRPAGRATTAVLEVRDRKAKSWRRLRSVRTNSRGYFKAGGSYRSGRRWRVRWGERAGAPIRAYRGR
jgi:hypothetical protein